MYIFNLENQSIRLPSKIAANIECRLAAYLFSKEGNQFSSQLLRQLYTYRGRVCILPFAAINELFMAI